MIGEKVISEKEFDLHYLNKFASLMTIGNGYLGMRATHEEKYGEQTRGFYVAGIYNKATPNDISELVNLPDIIGMKIEINGEIFSLLNGKTLSYERKLNLANGELTRDILWENSKGLRFKLKFQRFAGKQNIHLFGSKLTVTSIDDEATIKITTGIDAQQTNFGRQHLDELSVRVFDEAVMQGVYKTTSTEETIAIATGCVYSKQGHVTFAAKNRQLMTTANVSISKDESFTLEKKGIIHTSLEEQDPEKTNLLVMEEIIDSSYNELLENSTVEWQKFWDEKGVKIKSKDMFDQLALNFALYHVEIMTPSHDERFSVGAKGLTGEGYKGHVFWDTEIFIAPFHLFTEPEKMRKLLRYRYLNLQGAFDKASRNGYEGALFPWESAFSGQEETPEYAAINIRTGKRQKVASALAEHHIVADVAYAVVQYYQATKDDAFMRKEGLTLLKETSRFWISRAVEKNNKLVIEDVIGPDEYTEHIDNNAYTNYLAYYNVEQALRFMEKYQDVDQELLTKGKDFLERVYLPQPNDEKIIPQDDTFLSKPKIDLTKYKKKQGSQGILLDYSRAEVNELQVLKQADVVMLLYLLPDLFTNDIIAENMYFYEERTIHDSSLSKAIHAIVASWCGEKEAAYRFFKEACLIDLGPNPSSSDEGIHAASLGAIWLSTIFGFAGVSVHDEYLEINPNLPDEWEEIEFPFLWNGQKIHIRLTKNQIKINKDSPEPLEVKLNGQRVKLIDNLEINL